MHLHVALLHPILRLVQDWRASTNLQQDANIVDKGEPSRRRQTGSAPKALRLEGSSYPKALRLEGSPYAMLIHTPRMASPRPSPLRKLLTARPPAPAPNPAPSSLPPQYSSLH